MIFINRSITDLAPAYEQLRNFTYELEQEWIPGFIRSYTRRQAAYQKAIQRYDERGTLMRLLFKPPQPPGKLPAGVKEEITDRLWQDWLVAISDSETIQESDGLGATINDNYFALHNIRVAERELPVGVIVGPSGAYQIDLSSQHQSRLNLERYADFRDQSVENLAQDLNPLNQDILDKQTVFRIIDDLLIFHQAAAKEKTFSALPATNRIMMREKDYLLKLAAVL